MGGFFMILESDKAGKMSGGDALMHALIDNGADTVFGYPGGAIMPVYDSLHSFTNQIRHILTRHEQGATHAAEGYARMLGKPGVVFATSGPGATNTFTGLYDAFMDSTPLVVITGQVARPLIGTQAFQEAPIIEASRALTKWNYQVREASEIPAVVDEAFARASGGRPGPVLIDIPKDVQLEMTEYSRSGSVDRPGPELTSDTLAQLQQAAQLLNNAKRPFILAGQGVLISRAQRELLAMAEKTGIPVANTLLGLSSFPQDHQQFVGMLGMHGRYGANVLTNEADVILALGMRFDDRVTGRVKDYARQAKIMHVDIDPTQLGRLVQVEQGINLDARLALLVLLDQLDPNQHSAWLERFRKMDAVEDEQVTNGALSADSLKLKMGEVVDLLSRKTNGEAVIIADVGQHQMIAAQRYRFRQPHSFMTSGGMGTMGFALPASIGAKIAAPDREVIGIIGDGSFQMNIQELGTIAQEQLPVKTIILNNSYLGMVRQWQDLFHDGRRSFVHMINPDFATIAAGYGIPAEKVDNRADLNNALDRMLAAKTPYLLDVTVETAENVFPMIPSGAAVNEVRLT